MCLQTMQAGKVVQDLFCRIRYPFLCVDLLPVLGISLPPHGVEVAVGGTVLAQVLVRIVSGSIGAGAEPHRILAVAVTELDLHEKTTVQVHRGLMIEIIEINV